MCHICFGICLFEFVCGENFFFVNLVRKHSLRNVFHKLSRKFCNRTAKVKETTENRIINHIVESAKSKKQRKRNLQKSVVFNFFFLGFIKKLVDNSSSSRVGSIEASLLFLPFETEKDQQLQEKTISTRQKRLAE